MAEPRDRTAPDPAATGPAPGLAPQAAGIAPEAGAAGEPRPRGDTAPAAEAEWRKPQRPAFKPEEGEGDRSDWASLAKAALLILLPIAVIAWLLTR